MPGIERDSLAFCFAKQRIDQSADWSPGCRRQPGYSRSSPFSDKYKKRAVLKHNPLFGTPEGTRTPDLLIRSFHTNLPVNVVH